MIQKDKAYYLFIITIFLLEKVRLDKLKEKNNYKSLTILKLIIKIVNNI